MTRRRAAAAFVLAALSVLALGSTFDRLYDTDSYLHMALARHLAHAGPHAGISWARFSVLADGFGDKELLFHALLVPFATLLPVAKGGVAACALLVGALAALLVAVARRFSPGAAGWVPLLVLAGSADVLLRLLRVRPEALALLLLLLALDAASRRRWRTLAAVSVLFPLSYVAVPAYVGLFGILFVALLWRDRRAEWPLLLLPALGCAAGLLLHPQFPANLRIVKLVAVDLMRTKDVLDVGTEFQAPRLRDLLELNLGWLLALLVVLRARRPAPAPAEPETSRAALFFGLAALVYALLNVSMGRFAVYAVPFATLALLAHLRARGEELGPRVALPFRGSFPTALALVLALVAGLTVTRRVVAALDEAEVFRPAPDAEWARIRPLLPEDAKVAASWGSAEVYAWAFPRGRYLNLFDPALMAIPFPRLYRVQRGIWDGTEPDPAFAAYETLDSPYLLYHRSVDRGTLESRLLGDPRVTVLHRREELLARVDPDRNGAFLRDWRALPVPSAGSLPVDAAWPGAPRWPGARTARGRSVEGYVDATRLPPAPCHAFRAEIDAPRDGREPLEFSPWGPGALAVDGEPLAAVPAGTHAVLGKGILLPIPLSAGRHAVVVTTCAVNGRSGFYLLRR